MKNPNLSYILLPQVIENVIPGWNVSLKQTRKFNILDLDMNARNLKKWMSGQVNLQHFITTGVIKCAYDKEDFTFYQRDQFLKKDVEIQEQMR